MADIPARLEMRWDTAALWASANPVLGIAEPALEIDTGIIRIGDGVTAFTALPAIAAPDIVRASRQIASGTGLTGGGTLAADRTLALAGQSLALHNLASTGLIARTAADTVVARTMQGTAAQIVWTTGDGVAGNPTVSLVLPSQAEAEAGTDANKPMPALRVRQAIDARLALQSAAINLTGAGPFAQALPSWITEAEVMLRGASLSGTDHIRVQLSTGTAYVTTGYTSYSSASGSGVTAASGFILHMGNPPRAANVILTLRKFSGNEWLAIPSGSVGTGSDDGMTGSGNIVLAGAIDGIRVNATGSDTFDGTGQVVFRWR
jgi:hypothetical protein